jgi:hypothetical protein
MRGAYGLFGGHRSLNLSPTMPCMPRPTRATGETDKRGNPSNCHDEGEGEGEPARERKADEDDGGWTANFFRRPARTT